MGFYLNATSAYGLFREACSLTYFVDKTEILCDLVPLVELNRNVSEPLWKDGDGQHDCFLFRERRGQQWGV